MGGRKTTWALGPVGTLGSSTSSRSNGKLGEGFRMETVRLDLAEL